MFRIRRVYDDILPANREAITQAQEIMRSQFAAIAAETVEKLPRQIREPLVDGFQSLLWVADDLHGHIKGFALLLHAPDLNFCFLDFISTARVRMGGGVGSSLYARVREESLLLNCDGLFFELLPDDARLCPDSEVLKQNIQRLRFYERYGARPIINTAYETPVKPGGVCPPYLAYDDLGSGKPLRRNRARKVVEAILQRKYGELCPPDYIERVVNSFRDDPVRLREPRYVPEPKSAPIQMVSSMEKLVALVVTDVHRIHHVRERGYVESPVRIRSILSEIEKMEIFERIEPRYFSERHIRAVHDPNYVDYFKKICASLQPGKSIYPYVFPIRNRARPPLDLAVRAGYYCIDTFTPLNQNAFLAAKRGVDCALTAAEELLKGYRIAYALVRPPGHHAERQSFGGFCYFNSAAVAANLLSEQGPVAILDVDYHHGNGQQDIFYSRGDILTVSIHGHPRFAYPYFSGFEEEIGEAEGKGCNINIPLPENVDGERYRQTLARVLRRISDFRPRFLVVALGLDPAKGDPTGTWSLRAADFEANGRLLGALRLPTLVVQEGGYKTRSLGVNVRHFFQGLWAGLRSDVTLPGPAP